VSVVKDLTATVTKSAVVKDLTATVNKCVCC